MAVRDRSQVAVHDPHTDDEKNGTDLYDMIFATDHPAGQTIMSHLYKKAGEREPKMKREAIDAVSGQGTLFADFNAPVPEWKSEPCWAPSGSSWWRD